MWKLREKENSDFRQLNELEKINALLEQKLEMTDSELKETCTKLSIIEKEAKSSSWEIVSMKREQK